jgi:ABC-type oligopeptide transport system substrate-binding subunit
VIVRRQAAALALALGLAACGRTAPSGPAGPALTVGVVEDVQTLDPLRASDRVSLGLVRDIFQTLVRCRPGTGAVEPDAAVAWRTTHGGTTWVFTLAPGLRFSDGTPLDANAVKVNADRWRLREIARVDAPDARTVAITTNVPFAPLLHALALPAFGLASPVSHVGSGPYRLGDWVPGDHLTLVRNPWWRGRAPAFARVTVLFIPDPPTSVLSLIKNDVDVVADPTPALDIDLATRPHVTMRRRPSDQLVWLGFAPRARPFRDERVRRAIAEAIDPAGLRATQPYPPALDLAGGWLPDQTARREAAPLAERLAHARTLLQQARVLPLAVQLVDRVVPSSSLSSPDPIVQQIRADLQAAGIVVTDDPAANQVDVIATGTPSGDPDETLQPVAELSDDATLRGLVVLERRTLDPRERAAVVGRAERRIRDRVLAVPLLRTVPWFAERVGVDPGSVVP